MKKYIFFVTLIPMLAFSALAPLPQSLREINAIINYPALSDHLGSNAPIKEITKVCDGYLIITTSHAVKVTLQYSKESRIGPKKFTLHFGQSMPLLK